ncbi:MAG: hypothetical protein VKO44_07335 [Cyanobacteriota bacterium]|nr:hypothetical protein [Cyanobacteriota bacterium]
MAHPAASFTAFGRWLAEMVEHAFGDPRQDAALQPPMVGVQPFHGIPGRRRGVWS